MGNEILIFYRYSFSMKVKIMIHYRVIHSPTYETLPTSMVTSLYK